MHELAHATVWIKGSVKFNESFASFVGEVGAFQYLEDRFGPESEVVVKARRDHDDVQRWRALLRGLYSDLDDVFSDPNLDDSRKRSAKAMLFASLPQRHESATLRSFRRRAEQGRWLLGCSARVGAAALARGWHAARSARAVTLYMYIKGQGPGLVNVLLAAVPDRHQKNVLARSGGARD